MNTYCKKYLLIITLMTTSTHLIHSSNNNDPSIMQAIIEFFYGSSTQEQHNSRQPLANTTINDYIINLKASLNGLPQREVNEIAATVRNNLYSVDLSKPDHVSQSINSVLVEHIRIKTALDLSNAEKQYGIQLDHKSREVIINSYTNDFIERLGTLSYIEGQDIQQFFGNKRAASVNKLISNAVYGEQTFNHNPPKPTSAGHHSPYTQPAQQPTHYGQQSQQLPQHTRPQTYSDNSYNKREQYARQYAQHIEDTLKNSLAHSDIQQLKSFIIDSTVSVTSIPADNRLAHTKNGLAQLLDVKLETSRRNLKPHIINLQKLDESIESTRQQKIAEIEQLQTIDLNKIVGLLGNNSYGSNNIEESILTNMDIRCPVCYEEFKEEHRHGAVDRVILKAADAGKSCGHAVCKTCVSGCHNSCPQCRASVDTTDLNRKMRGH